MINGKHVTVVLPAYNAEKTLQKTYDEVPKDIVDKIILTDDASHEYQRRYKPPTSDAHVTLVVVPITMAVN